MSYITDHQEKLTKLKIQFENQDQLSRQANGGNSILFTYPPEDEHLYLEKIREIYADTATFIDVSKLLVQFIDQDTWKDFSEYYENMKSSPHKVFKSEDDSTPDLYELIIKAVCEACDNDRIPILIRTGCLFGTGIENVNIMEHASVMALKHPLVICYPSTHSDGNILFLGFKPASTYRCTLVK
jgi:hypothetical protein